MKAEEKAKDLIEKFNKSLWMDEKDKDVAKQCAVICVEEILNNIKAIEDNYDDEFLGGYKQYWQQVLSIIKST